MKHVVVCLEDNGLKNFINHARGGWLGIQHAEEPTEFDTSILGFGLRLDRDGDLWIEVKDGKWIPVVIQDIRTLANQKEYAKTTTSQLQEYGPLRRSLWIPE